MKGLDTPILLDILEGRPSAKKLIQRMEGEEVCTTEANMLELVAVARSLGTAGLPGRLAAIERLRRTLTVLPLDAKAASAASNRWKGKGAPPSTLQWLVAGALDANGCSEWITDRATSIPGAFPRLRVTRFSS
jgi:predicted nucleic acid-binding protein